MIAETLLNLLALTVVALLVVAAVASCSGAA